MAKTQWGISDKLSRVHLGGMFNLSDVRYTSRSGRLNRIEIESIVGRETSIVPKLIYPGNIVAIFGELLLYLLQ